MSDLTLISAASGETLTLGERIAPLLTRGSIVALRGGLGAGKTCLTKGLARGLGVRETITSPTYTIISEYQGQSETLGSFPFYHIDAYRLGGDDDFTALGAEEMLYGEGISVIEWSERIPLSIPPEAITIEFEVLEGDNRRIRIMGLRMEQDCLQ
jgi:tRNA threonylcarbamoyladenosine biosynthesis protein TsaE